MSDIETEEVSLETSANDGEIASAAYDAHEFERRLIEEISQRPFLYDHTNGGFKDLKRKDAAWVVVAEAVGKSVNKCQCRWKSLRDRYVRESRKLREGNGPKRHMWEMFKFLTFLDDIPRLHRGGGGGGGARYVEPSSWPIKTTSGRTSGRRPALFVLPTSSTTTPQTQSLQVAVTSAITTTSYVTTPVVSPPSTITVSSPSASPILTVALTEMVNRKATPATSTAINNNSSSSNNNGSVNTNSVTMTPFNNNSNILTTFVDMADGCSAFGMSVSATLRTLPLEQQELAKLRIQQVLYEVQFS